MKTVRQIVALRELLDGYRQDGETLAIVPTMGSLHKGHMTLVNLAREHADRVVTTIFVNPAQFGPHEDFDSYPRQFENDRRKLSRSGVDVLFAPTTEEMYPFGMEEMARVSVPGLSGILEGHQRPGHFDGVTSVVSRLFNIVGPDVAVFGQKDFQQLSIIRRMVNDLHLPVRIVDCPTQREASGLALSSRNQYLDEAQRIRAASLYQVICECRDHCLAGRTDWPAIEQSGLEKLESAGFAPEYLVIRNPADLSAPDKTAKHLIILAAARLGDTRLIDNELFELDQ